MKKLLCGVVLAAVLVTPAMAQDGVEDDSAMAYADAPSGNPKAGIRVELRASYETPTIEGEEIFEDDDDLYKLGSAVAFGGEAGFDFAVSDRVVVGPYGNYEKSNVESCVDGDCLRAKDSLSAGLHLGFLTGSTGMVYGKVGYTELTLEAEGLFEGAIVSGTDTGGGISGALGFEFGFGPNLYGRVEGGYANVGEIFGVEWQRRYAGVALGARF